MQRRTLLSTLTVVGTVTIAGCSNSSEPASDPEDGESEGGSDNDTEQEQQDSDQDTQEQNGDTVHKGEEELEQYMEILREEGTILAQRRYEWVELENIEDQTEKPIAEFVTGTVFKGLAKGGPAPYGDIDTVYVAVQSGRTDSLDFVYLDSDNWDEDISAEENWQEGFYNDSPSSLEEDDLIELFSNDISGYSDVSDDFSSEYLEAIEG